MRCVVRLLVATPVLPPLALPIRHVLNVPYDDEAYFSSGWFLKGAWRQCPASLGDARNQRDEKWKILTSLLIGAGTAAFGSSGPKMCSLRKRQVRPMDTSNRCSNTRFTLRAAYESRRQTLLPIACCRVCTIVDLLLQPAMGKKLCLQASQAAWKRVSATSTSYPRACDQQLALRTCIDACAA
jgi:hypothetical protein